MTNLPPNHEIDDYEPSNHDYINRIKYDDDPRVRANAVFVLGRLNDISALPTMLTALENDESQEVRLQIVEILGKFKTQDVVSPLLKALESDDTDMRAMAAKSLGLAGQSGAIPLLVNALGDSEAQVRAQVAEALGELRAEGAVALLVNTLVADDDSNVRYFAIQSLVTIGGDAVLDNLCNRLERESNLGVIIDLIETIAKLKAPSALDRLRPYADHADDDVKATAKWAIDVLEKLS
jgi:HEAT repeat protein